jgi:hypothetical protein
MNLSAFDTVPSKDDIRRYNASHPEQIHPPKSTQEPYIFGRQNVKSLILILCSIALAVLSFTIETVFATVNPLSTTLNYLTIIGIGLTIYLLIRLHFHNQRYRWSLGVKLSRFAQNNNFRYERYQEYTNSEGLLSPLPTIYVGSGNPTTLTGVKNESITTPNYEVADVFVSLPKGNIYRSYLRIPLNVESPHIILMSRGYAIYTNKPADYQTIDPDSKFKRTFKLYAANEGQELARTIFTPELLGLLKENIWSANTAVEIINKSVYVYYTADWTDKAFWNKTQTIYRLINQGIAQSTTTE